MILEAVMGAEGQNRRAKAGAAPSSGGERAPGAIPHRGRGPPFSRVLALRAKHLPEGKRAPVPPLESLFVDVLLLFQCWQ